MRQEDGEYKTSLGYRVRPCFKKQNKKWLQLWRCSVTLSTSSPYQVLIQRGLLYLYGPSKFRIRKKTGPVSPMKSSIQNRHSCSVSFWLWKEDSKVVESTGFEARCSEFKSWTDNWAKATQARSWMIWRCYWTFPWLVSSLIKWGRGIIMEFLITFAAKKVNTNIGLSTEN
jgi:hypothetical protein